MSGGYRIARKSSSPDMLAYEYSDDSVSFVFDRQMRPDKIGTQEAPVECYTLWSVGPKIARHEVNLGAHFEYMDNIREFFSSVERLKTSAARVMLAFIFTPDRLLPKWRQHTGVVMLRDMGPAWRIECEVQ